MNKLFLTLFAVAAMTAVSCKKEYVCQCSKTYTSGTGTTTFDYSKFTYKDNKVRATSKCNENERSDSDIFGNYSIECDIK